MRASFPHAAPPAPVREGRIEGCAEIKDGDGREELYDFERDPLERTDLAGQGAATVRFSLFRRALDEMRPAPRKRI